MATLLTTPQVAKALGVPVSTLWSRMYKGIVTPPKRKVGGHYFWTATERDRARRQSNKIKLGRPPKEG